MGISFPEQNAVLTLPQGRMAGNAGAAEHVVIQIFVSCTLPEHRLVCVFLHANLEPLK